jgi:hypothetical protein
MLRANSVGFRLVNRTRLNLPELLTKRCFVDALGIYDAYQVR